MRGERQEHLGRRECIAQCVMLTVNGKIQTPRELVERARRGRLVSQKGQELAEFARIEDGAAQTKSLTGECPAEERSFDPGHVHNQDPSGHRIDERPYRFIKGRRIGEVDRANPVNEYGLLRERSSRLAQSVQGVAGDHATGVDGHGGK